MNRESVFKGMPCAYAAIFTPYGAKGRVNPETISRIIPKHFTRICALAAKDKFREAAKLQDEANRVVELMIESDNWSYRKAMMKFIGLDCGSYRKPFEPLTAAQYRAYAKRFAAIGLVTRDQAVKGKRPTR